MFDNLPKFTQFKNKRIMALDYGRKVTGVATFTPGIDPYPLMYGKIIYKNDIQLADEVKELIDNESIDIIVLGIPFLLDGGETPMTRQVRDFGALLEKFSIELYYQDETLTTFEAEERMKNSPRYNFKVDPKEIDALAASIILEDFIKS